MTDTVTRPLTTPETLNEETIRSYRDRGFVRIRGIIAPDEAAEFREAALKASGKLQKFSDGAVFTQLVNVWRDDPDMRRLTFHPNVAAVAERLNGTKLRLWHDQILIKQPRNNAATEFHQDQPYWPHADSPNPISAWIALCDVPVQRGCMSFIPGSHRRTDLERQNLRDSHSLFGICPDLEWIEQITHPLRAGDCTFHHGRCAHAAGPNQTDVPRVAHVVIFMETQTRYRPQKHPVTDPLNLQPGQALDGEMFPAVGQFGALAKA